MSSSLELLANFEKRANSRVVESGMLRGVNLDDIRRAGEHMKLHDGCKDFFQNIVKMKEMLTVDLHILSYCWCADLIRAAFSSGNDLICPVALLLLQYYLSISYSCTSLLGHIDNANMLCYKDKWGNEEHTCHLGIFHHEVKFISDLSEFCLLTK